MHRTVIVGIAAVLTLTACGSSGSTGAPRTAVTNSATSSSGSGYPMTISVGGSTLTFNSAPKRILVKNYEAAYLVAAAGGNETHKIVAYANRNSDGFQPANPVLSTLDGVKQISPDSDLTKEVIIAQRPDLVIGHDFSTSPQDQLAAVGIKSFIVDPCSGAWADEHGGKASLDEIYDDITIIGKLLGTESYAQASIAKLKATVATITADAPKLKAKLSNPTAAFAYIYDGGFYTYGPPSIADAQIRALGLTNTFSDLKERGTQLTAEEFIQRDPGLIVIATGFKEGETNADVMKEFLAYPGIQKLRAVRAGHVAVLHGGDILSSAVTGLEDIVSQANSFK